MATDATTARLYRRHRREGKPAAHAWYVAKNVRAWHRLDWTGEGAWLELEHDGLTYRVALTTDDDAWSLYREDVENGILEDDEQPTYAYWCVVIECNGRTVDALGGISGGYVDDRGYASEDDDLIAYVWADVVWPAVQEHARSDRDAWARRLEMVGSE